MMSHVSAVAPREGGSEIAMLASAELTCRILRAPKEDCVGERVRDERSRERANSISPTLALAIDRFGRQG